MAKVQIKDELLEKIEKRVRGTGFKNVREYIEFVLSEVVKKTEEKEKMSAEDEEKVKERLRSLGYLD